MRIYTKIGDAGTTRLFGGEEVGKDDLRVCAYGELDELNAHIGVALNVVSWRFRPTLSRIQSELFELGGELATPGGKNVTIADTQIAVMEREIDRLMADAPELRNFVLPAGGAGAAELHVARTVCRRAERAMVRLNAREPIRAEALRYVNRLSDLLFAMSRAAVVHAGLKETVWRPRGAKEETE